MKQLHERNTAKFWHETIAWKEHCQVLAWNNCMKGTLPKLGTKQLHERNTAKSWAWNNCMKGTLPVWAWNNLMKGTLQSLGMKQLHERNAALSWYETIAWKERCQVLGKKHKTIHKSAVHTFFLMLSPHLSKWALLYSNYCWNTHCSFLQTSSNFAHSTRISLFARLRALLYVQHCSRFWKVWRGLK